MHENFKKYFDSQLK